MIVAGGTYNETCFEPRWEEKYGSGYRACRSINQLDPTLNINFYTFGDEITATFLEQIKTVYTGIESHVTAIPHTVSFYYDHPLIEPRIYPRLDTVNKSNNQIEISGGDILYFGFIEGGCKVTGDRVVYDPQSPINPISFSKTGSSANKLAMVVNYREATLLAGSHKIEEIKQFFLEKEEAIVLVLKMGPKGAIVIDRENDTEDLIPVYKTPSVWPIGSGDVFASCFAYYWFNNLSARLAAEKASLHTAQYCASRQLEFSSIESNFEPLTISNFPIGEIYLAGPFFTYSQRWLIDQIRSSLQSMHLKVFSPWHDVGHGIASEVVPKDIKALENAKFIFAVIDGLDSGTLFEVGYAVKKQIPVLAYVENETKESIKMLEGTGCFLEKDFTTAIYKSFWILAENE